MAGRDVQVRIGTLDQYLTPQAREEILRRLAMLAIGRIKRRTGQGKDVEGKAFAPYSKGYAKQRTQAGRNATPPTLLLSGAMLGSMKILRSTSQEAVIGFEGSAAATKFTKRARPSKNRKTGARVTHSVGAGSKRVANALKARWNDQGEGKNPRRHFFGLSPEDRRALTRDGIKQVIEAVRTASFQRISSAGALREARRAAGRGR